MQQDRISRFRRRSLRALVQARGANGDWSESTMMEFEGLAQMLATGQCTAELTQMLSDPYYLQRRLALGSYHDLLHELDVCEAALQELVSHERVERRSTAADSGISHCCRTLILQSHVLPIPRHTTSLTHCLLPMHCTAYSSSNPMRGIFFFETILSRRDYLQHIREFIKDHGAALEVPVHAKNLFAELLTNPDPRLLTAGVRPLVLRFDAFVRASHEWLQMIKNPKHRPFQVCRFFPPFHSHSLARFLFRFLSSLTTGASDSSYILGMSAVEIRRRISGFRKRRHCQGGRGIEGGARACARRKCGAAARVTDAREPGDVGGLRGLFRAGDSGGGFGRARQRRPCNRPGEADFPPKCLASKIMRYVWGGYD